MKFFDDKEQLDIIDLAYRLYTVRFRDRDIEMADKLRGKLIKKSVLCQYTKDDLIIIFDSFKISVKNLIKNPNNKKKYMLTMEVNEARSFINLWNKNHETA